MMITKEQQLMIRASAGLMVSTLVAMPKEEAHALLLLIVTGYFAGATADWDTLLAELDRFGETCTETMERGTFDKDLNAAMKELREARKGVER